MSDQPTNNPQGPPPPPQGGYGQQPYGGYQPGAQSSGKSVAILVLGIVGLVLICGYGVGVVPAIVALALAPGAKREIQQSGGRLTGEAFIKAGVICSWVAVGLTILAIVIIVAVVIVSAMGATNSSF